MSNLIEILKHKQWLWHGVDEKSNIHAQIKSSFLELDRQLDGGFPEKGVIELRSPIGIGELRLLMPVLAADHQQGQQLCVFINPPGNINAQMLQSSGVESEKVLVIYPKTIHDGLWTAEQCLKSGSCSSVLLWQDSALAIHQVKRLQLACDTGQSRQFIMRQEKSESMSLPFDLSITLNAQETGLVAKINKRKQGWPSDEFIINMAKSWPLLTCYASNRNLIPFPQKKVG
ncbi:translesion DNA synthesis-associated protein ImuA [Thalassotalea crassostreae]|uniref:translesion DNA synthesis-associated protein ImuA n=1 Tax=Thalassotalea crassostreae TaxID=1763536 RepID=UPI000838443F|nr:translesion DNA synthesis-associated protein ImuA [Thalassotalea crassostreae]